MTSQIDITKPTQGNALTADVRSNFATAANEITALQAAITSGTLSLFLQSLDQLAGTGLLKKTGPGTSAIVTTTAFTEALLDAANAAAVQAAIGLGTAAIHAATDFAPVAHTHTANDYVTMIGDSGSGGVKGAVPAPPAGASGSVLYGNGQWQGLQGTLGGNINGNGKQISNAVLKGYSETFIDNGSVTGTGALNFSNGTYQRVTLTGNTTFTLAGLPPSSTGAAMIVLVIQDATGGRTATFSGVKWGGGTPPVVSSAANAQTILSFVCYNISGTTTVYGFTGGLAMA